MFGSRVCWFASTADLWFDCIFCRGEVVSFPSLPSYFPPSLFVVQLSALQLLFSQEQHTSYCQFQSSGRCFALGSCLPKDRGVASLKTSDFSILKAARLKLSQKPIMQLSLSMLSPYASLMGSCFQSKQDCPLFHSTTGGVHMCNRAGGVCAQGGRVSAKGSKCRKQQGEFACHICYETWQHLRFSIFPSRI